MKRREMAVIMAADKAVDAWGDYLNSRHAKAAGDDSRPEVNLGRVSACMDDLIVALCNLEAKQ